MTKQFNTVKFTTSTTLSAHDVFKAYAQKLVKENPELKIRSHNGVSSYLVVKPDKTVLIDFKTFKQVLALYNTKAGTKLINGYSINLLNGLGYLYVARIKRSLIAKPKLNKGLSYKLRKELLEKGELTRDNWKRYYTDDDYVKVMWFKPSYTRANVAGFDNVIFYKFLPAGGNKGKGFKQRLSVSIRHKSELLALYPYIVNKKKKAA